MLPSVLPKLGTDSAVSLHAAMLLTAAKMLKENEESLNGQVKFMFQPAEEIFQGADRKSVV